MNKEEIIKKEKTTENPKGENVKENALQKSFHKEKKISGIIYIHSTYNNTVIHLTDLANNTLAQISGGKITKHSRLKATPTVAMFAAKRVAEIAKEAKIGAVYVRIKSSTGSATPGPGARAAIKSFDREGLKILNILDTTRIPRGGPKKSGGKRGRRV